ncbi:MAG: sugar phosphate isomerase/epimerase [Clostridia bacterium]|nr:sugar phosphate isomerase/epimerase [Clostridia bacterium]MBR3716161.1 sugar phosphate isomerase/epimerase [Clostridia bacterium]
MKLSMPIYPLEPRFGTEKSLDLIKDAGFEAVDYSLGSLVADDSVFNSDEYKARALEIRRMADQRGLKINQTHAPFTFSINLWNDPDAFENIIMPRFYRNLEISAILGADVSVVHPLHHWTYLGHEEEIFEKNMEYYRRLIPYAKEYGVKIGVENMFQVDPRRKFIICDTCSEIKEFVRYIDELDSEQIVACLDIGHIGLVQQKEEAWDYIRALGHDRLKSLHVHDNDYRADQHKLPYTGIINWKEVIKALGEIDYDGDFTYETGFVVNTMDEEVVPIGLKFMADIGHNMVSRIDACRPGKGE